MGKCSKGEISHPAPLKVPFSSNNNYISSSATPCETKEKNIFWTCLVIFLRSVLSDYARSI